MDDRKEKLREERAKIDELLIKYWSVIVDKKEVQKAIDRLR